MEKKTRNMLFVLAALAVLVLFGKVTETTSASARDQTAVSSTRAAAYVAAKAFAKQRLGAGEYGAADDGYTEYGDGTYMVSGVTDLPGKRAHWTVEMRYLGGSPYELQSWQEIRWTVR